MYGGLADGTRVLPGPGGAKVLPNPRVLEIRSLHLLLHLLPRPHGELLRPMPGHLDMPAGMGAAGGNPTDFLLTDGTARKNRTPQAHGGHERALYLVPADSVTHKPAGDHGT